MKLNNTKLAFEDLGVGLTGHVNSNAELKRHLFLLAESLECESFETASMYASNLSKVLYTRHEYETMKAGAK